MFRQNTVTKEKVMTAQADENDNNGFNEADCTLLFENNKNCSKPIDRTLTTAQLLSDNMHYVSLYEANVSIGNVQLLTMYAVIDNNPLQISSDGKLFEELFFHCDKETNCVFELAIKERNGAVIPDSTDGYTRISNVYVPHGSDKLNLLQSAMKRHNIIKRDIV